MKFYRDIWLDYDKPWAGFQEDYSTDLKLEINPDYRPHAFESIDAVLASNIESEWLMIVEFAISCRTIQNLFLKAELPRATRLLKYHKNPINANNWTFIEEKILGPENL